MPDRLPLTAAQQGVWIGQQLRPSSPAYNAAERIEIDGALDVDAFREALRRTVAEADVLHVTFEADAHGVSQLPHPPNEWELPIVDVTDRMAEQWMRGDLETVVDLQKGPLFAHALFRLGPNRFWWYHRAHHIALDGYSFGLIASRAAQHYTALVTGHPVPTARFGALRSVVDEDAAYRDSPQWTVDREFWLDYCADRLDPISLSGRITMPTGTVTRRDTTLPDNAMDRWRALADEHGGTWAEVVTACVAWYLRRHTGADEVVLGLPVMGRMGSTAARIPVMVMNIVPLRIPVRGDVTSLIPAVASQLRTVRPHLRYRGEQLRRDLGLVGGERRLFGPMVNIMPFDYGLDFAGHRAVATNLSAGSAFVEDLAVLVHARSDNRPPVLDIDANPACYSDDDLAHHLDGLTALLGNDT